MGSPTSTTEPVKGKNHSGDKLEEKKLKLPSASLTISTLPPKEVKEAAPKAERLDLGNVTAIPSKGIVTPEAPKASPEKIQEKVKSPKE